MKLKKKLKIDNWIYIDLKWKVKLMMMMMTFFYCKKKKTHHHTQSGLCPLHASSYPAVRDLCPCGNFLNCPFVFPNLTKTLGWVGGFKDYLRHRLLYSCSLIFTIHICPHLHTKGDFLILIDILKCWILSKYSNWRALGIGTAKLQFGLDGDF